MRTGITLVFLSSFIACSLLSSKEVKTTPPTALGEKIIRLPEFAVTEKMKLRPEEKWLTGQLSNFEIFSNASEKETRDFVSRLHRFHQAFTLLFPKVTSISRDKITLVLCGSRDKYLALAPLAAAEIDAKQGNLAYKTLTNDLETIFLINLDVKSEFGDGIGTHAADGANNFAQHTGAEFVDGETLLRQQYIRLLLSRSQPRPPAWLEEGVARYFDSLKVNKNTITFAQLDMGLTRYFSRGAGIPRRMLPMAKLFAVTYDSPEYQKATGGKFSNQSLAFVHFALLSHKGRYREAFFGFIDQASKGPITEAMFQDFFKMSFSKMESLLDDYVQGGFYRHVVVPKSSPLPPAPDLELHATTDAESGRIKGDTLRLVQRYEDARIELISPIMRRHADARLLGSLGQLDYETKNTAGARKFLEEAITAKADVPAPYITLARLRMEEAFGDPHQGSLSPAQLAGVLKPLFAALALNQPRVEIYTLIADAWLHTRAVPTLDNLVVLDEGVIKFPRNTDLIFKDASLKARNGFTDDAHSLIELGLKMSRDTETQARFEQLRTLLPPVPAASAAPSVTPIPAASL